MRSSPELKPVRAVWRNRACTFEQVTSCKQLVNGSPEAMPRSLVSFLLAGAVLASLLVGLVAGAIAMALMGLAQQARQALR